MNQQYTLIVEKWQARPEAKWVPHRTQEVIGYATAKRIRLFSNGGKVFNRQTGREIKPKGAFSSYRYTLKVPGESATDVPNLTERRA